MWKRLDRRALLSLIGAAVGAGCNSRAPESDTDTATRTPSATSTATATPTPAEFSVAYEHPTSVEVGQAVAVTVTVTNTGGRAATFAASPSVTRPSDTQQTGPRQELGVISPGETVAVTSPTYDLNYLGRYTFRFGASAPPTTIRTRPATLAWDRAFQAPHGYQLRVGAPDLQQTYSYVTPNGIGQERADPNELWAFVPIEVANPTDDAATAPAADDFTIFPSDTPYDRTALTEQPIYQGQPYVATTLQPGGKRSGYIPYTIPAGAIVDDLRIVWDTSVSSGTVAVSWQSAGLPPYRGQ